MAELTYRKVGDYYIPDLILDEEPEQDVFYGKYGDLRRDYLREHKPKLWMVLVNSGKLTDHLKGVERMAAAHGHAPAAVDESRWRDRGIESP
jgi:hypothetical protein